MVKIRTVIPPNAKPGTSVIQVVNPKTNKPTRIRVPANAQPGQVIELELPDDSHKSSVHASASPAKLGGVPAPMVTEKQTTSQTNPAPYEQTRRTIQADNTPGSKQRSEDAPRNGMSSEKLSSRGYVSSPAQQAIRDNRTDTDEDEPLVSENQKRSASDKENDDVGCCFSFMQHPFKCCSTLC